MIITAAVALILASCVGSGEVGKSYEDFGELIKDQNSKGYVFLGRFDNTWPAEVTDVRTAMHEISFERKEGPKHRYHGYDGYELKVIRLIASNKTENIVVLRSKEKK
jgi:hypothetical protein